MSTKDQDFITGGGIRVDYLITRDGEAHNGKIGGNAIYAAVGAAIWSDSVSVWGTVGDNYPSKWIAQLEDLGINGIGLKSVEGNHDHRTFYAYLANGTRDDTQPEKHYARIGQPMPRALADYHDSTPMQDDPEVFEPLALRIEDWPKHFQGATAIHLAPLPLRTHLEVVPYLSEQDIGQISVDPGERYMKPQLAIYLRRFLPFVDVFLPSEKEIISLFGSDTDLLVAAKTLGDWGAKIVVIKRGSRGVLLYHHGRSQLIQLDAYHRKGDNRIIDVTGAGDSFCGGFMVGLATNKGMQYAARVGLVSASLTIEGYGALYPLQISRTERLTRLKVLESRQSLVF